MRGCEPFIILMRFKLGQSFNTLLPIERMDIGMDNSVSQLHPQKASLPISITDEGTVSLIMWLNFKAALPILRRSFGRKGLSNELQLQKV